MELDVNFNIFIEDKLYALPSRISEIQKLCNTNDNDDEFNNLELDAHDLPNHCALHLESTVQQIVSDFPSLGIQDADLHHLKEELKNLNLETAHVANQIQLLAKSHNDDCILLEAKLEEMECSLDYITSKDQNTAEATEGIDSPMLEDDCSNLTVVNLDENLETYMPTFEGISFLPRVEDTIDAAELNHEFLVEVFEGTMKLKNVQVFPNDIYVNDIVDTAKSVSNSSLQWFIQKVQDRIILSTLRHLVVKDANKSRHSLEYLDKDETIVVHMAGEIDVYIKLSYGWPIFGSPLKLICIKGSDDLKRTSLSFHCKVEKLANSLDTHIRQNISSFVDAVEKVLIEQLQLDLGAGDSSG
ncbi:hypothetical protein E2542_SST29892 [Spatholobus suberectus]|nr:hypothetical protein E2542_SST29892 [Spatholobus suberectus]